MNFTVVCYRAILKNVRACGWRYRGGIDVRNIKDEDYDTYIWKNSPSDIEEDNFHPIQTHGVVPDGVDRPDLHTLVYTLKKLILDWDATNDAIDDLVTLVKETNSIEEEWDSFYLNETCE